MATRKHPKAIIIHLGSNDLVATKSSALYLEIYTSLLRIQLLMPSTKIIWSNILPRRHWMGAHSYSAIDKARSTLNRRVGNRVRELGGIQIHHPAIRAIYSDMYIWDGVHLSNKGQRLFVNNLLAAVKLFRK